MIKKLITTQLMLTLSLAGLLFAGNNKSISKEPNKDSKRNEQVIMNENALPPDMMTLPFNALVIKHTVADYSVWKSVFDADSTKRIAAGLHKIGVSRGIENPNLVNIAFMVEDVQKAKAFRSDPSRKEVMDKAGVISAPMVKFIKVLRMTKEMQKLLDYVEVTIKVKDFDAWLKVFDGEGAAMRTKDGMVDLVLAQGIDDPNLVYLVFKITDLAQAKAAMDNPARQKLMKKSGVIGQPEVYYGRDQM